MCHYHLIFPFLFKKIILLSSYIILQIIYFPNFWLFLSDLWNVGLCLLQPSDISIGISKMHLNQTASHGAWIFSYSLSIPSFINKTPQSKKFDYLTEPCIQITPALLQTTKIHYLLPASKLGKGPIISQLNTTIYWLPLLSQHSRLLTLILKCWCFQDSVSSFSSLSTCSQSSFDAFLWFQLTLIQ